MLVTYHPSKLAESQKQACDKIVQLLQDAGTRVEHYYGALPNPTTDCVDNGVQLAEQKNVDFIVALGGGSVIDTAKMIAFRMANPNLQWEQLFLGFSSPFPEVEPQCNPAMPLLAISTTSGTGSQVTQAAVITNTLSGQKTSVFHSCLYPKTCIVDPELMLTVPAKITADTGFDAFSHAFESYINKNATPFSEILSLEAIRLIVKWLPVAVKDGSNLEAREKLAFADTLAGKSLSMAGASLPHPLSEEIGSLFPKIAHGRALALVYPDYFKYAAMSAPEKFAAVGRILDPKLENVPDSVAAVKASKVFDKFMKSIDQWNSFADFEIAFSDVKIIAKHLGPVGQRMSPWAAGEEEIGKILQGAMKR